MSKHDHIIAALVKERIAGDLYGMMASDMREMSRHWKTAAQMFGKENDTLFQEVMADFNSVYSYLTSPKSSRLQKRS